MAFDYDETNPTDGSYIADYPQNERDHRAAVLGSVDADHFAETDGAHRQVTLPPLGSDPTLAGTAGFVYTKDVSGVTELFYQDENGTVIQLSTNGVVNAVGKVAKAGDTMTGDLQLDNLTAIEGHDAAAANYRNLAHVDGSDVAQYGDQDLAGGLVLNADGVDEASVDYPASGGKKKIWHEGNLTPSTYVPQTSDFSGGQKHCYLDGGGLICMGKQASPGGAGASISASFDEQFDATPHCVVTPNGNSNPNDGEDQAWWFTALTSSGFTIQLGNDLAVPHIEYVAVGAGTP